MEWLHFSDFHMGHATAPQKEAVSSLLSFLKNKCNEDQRKIDAIFITGDIAFSGKENEYLMFEELFLNPLRQIKSTNESIIIATPGNHDLCCTSAIPITWNSIKSRQKAFFSEDADGVLIRQSRVAAFNAYTDFIRRNRIVSPDPGKEVSVLYQNEEFPVDIIATNTSFFSDIDYPANEKSTPCPLMSLRSILDSQSFSKPLLLLGHHPISCFLEEQQKPFESLLIDHNVIYLHGHTHDPKIISTPTGTISSVGFGACYQASLGSGISYYRNSFVKCKISDRLEINGVAWDPSTGRWEESSITMFPNCKSCHRDGIISLNMPTPIKPQLAQAPNKALSVLPRVHAVPQSTFIISEPDERLWEKVASLSEIISKKNFSDITTKLVLLNKSQEKIEYTIEINNERCLLICIPGYNHIISAKEIESYNTRLDTESFVSLIIVSFGKMSGDAKDMYLRLKRKKSIEVLVNSDISSKWDVLLSSKQKEFQLGSETSSDYISILIGSDTNYILQNGTTSFVVIDKYGEMLAPTDGIIVYLREISPDFRGKSYGSDTAQDNIDLFSFNEQEYFQSCYKECNVMKYAALANVGIRFSDISFEDVYIDASACEIERANNNKIDDLLEDHLALYPLSEKLKTEIKEQITNNAGERNEISQAREFCQKYSAVLITGDPGSGKTCFVKNEILSYCNRIVKPEKDESQWHSFHTPILIHLSQAAAEKDIEATGMIQVISRLLEYRGLFFPASEIESMLTEGKIALFFDGLDEIVSVEKRAAIVELINTLADKYLKFGNRIIVTSRPAAINVVNLLPDFHQLDLQGLTNAEIAALASRILGLKLGESQNGGVVILSDNTNLSDSAIISQLINDCNEKPGVARFATNPLLLTLLVMIYANSGAPSAKRHKIYEEAIKTLASVRGREAGHEPVSVQDLKERLGSVALSVYRKESGFLPTRKEVSEIIRNTIAKQRNGPATKLEADKFIQKVAESTGLIVIGGDSSSSDESAIVTFMHHSFMEYFAAVALSKELDNIDALALVRQPRWMEILTLLSGIIGENADITNVLKKFIDDGSNYGNIDSKYLIFALDCALESEVPSESAVSLIAKSVSDCIESGPAKIDPWVRSEIGHRLSQLIDSCGMSCFETAFLSLLQSSNANTCASAISILSYIIGNNNDDNIIKEIENCCTRTEDIIQIAICDIAAKVGKARTPVILQVIQRCLKKSNRCKLAAFDAIVSIPALADRHWPEIINGLTDKNQNISRAAAKAAIQAGLNSDLATLNDTRKDVIVNALHLISRSAIADLPAGKIHKDTLENLLKSRIFKDRLIGIQMIPFVDESGSYMYQLLIDIINDSNDHYETTAALKSSQRCYDARVLFSFDDIKKIEKLCIKGTADVRKSGIQLLGYFSGDPRVVSILLDFDLSDKDCDELEAVYSSLAKSKSLTNDILSVFEKNIKRLLSKSTKMNDNYVNELNALLDSARQLGKNMQNDTSAQIRNLIHDYKQCESVKKAALRAYPTVAMPSTQLIEFIIKLFENPPIGFEFEIAQTLNSVAKNCRQSIALVLATVDALPALQFAAKDFHQRLSKRDPSNELQFIITELRDGIGSIDQIMTTFEEFIVPLKDK